MTDAARARHCLCRRCDVTNPGGFNTIQQAIRLYERATGARLNPRKSKALAIGAWTEPQ